VPQHREAFKAREIFALFKLSGIEFSMILFVKNVHVHVNRNCLLFPEKIKWGDIDQNNSYWV
jgi:hypothetical protein